MRRFSPPEWWKDDPFENVVEARRRCLAPICASGQYPHFETLLQAERRVRTKKLETVSPVELPKVQAEIFLIDQLLGLNFFVTTETNEGE